MSTRALRVMATARSDRLGQRRVERRSVAGLTCLAADAEGDAAPTLVFANACTPAGLATPGIPGFLAGVAHSGLNALAPELPGLREGRITLGSLDGLVRVAADCDGP